MSKPVAIMLLVVSVATWSFKHRKPFSPEGAWTIAEVQTVKPDGTYTSVFPKESLAVFTATHYSFCWTTASAAAQTWQMADSIKLSRVNQSIVNTGAYEMKDSLLTQKASFALNPMFINGIARFKCSFRGDTLILTGLSVVSANGTSHPLYAAGSHIVNKLVRVKVN